MGQDFLEIQYVRQELELQFSLKIDSEPDLTFNLKGIRT